MSLSTHEIFGVGFYRTVVGGTSTVENLLKTMPKSNLTPLRCLCVHSMLVIVFSL